MFALSVLPFVASVLAADSIPSCGDGLDLCPEEYPCCSSDGTCGNGYVCLGGCDPRYSNVPGACVPMPKFQDNYQYTFDGSSDIVQYADYLGDAEKMPWSYYGNITYVDNKLRAQMFSDNQATTVSSGYYLWYGKATIKMRTSRTTGVVSDFILISGVKDEIDYEFVGFDLTHAQTNYYWNGVLNYENMIAEPISSDSQADFHEYTIDWQEDHIDWIIDGSTVRTLKKSDTYNSTTGAYEFPATPCRVQFGLWPGGDSSAEGTAEWAGGQIDWNSADMQDPGYFYIEVDSIEVEPYDPPSGSNVTGSKSYVYTKIENDVDSVALTDDDYVLGSTDGTGLRLNGTLTKSDNSSSSSLVSSEPASSSTQASSSFESSTTVNTTTSATSTTSNSSTIASSSFFNSTTAVPSSSFVNTTTTTSSNSTTSSPTILSSVTSTRSNISSTVHPTTSLHNSTVSSTGTHTTTTSTHSNATTSTHATSAPASSTTTSITRNAAAALLAPALAFIVPLLM